MGMGLNKRTRLIQVMNSVAAGTSTQTSSSVDMSQNGGYRGLRFIASLGTLTSTQVTSMKVAGSLDNSSFNDLKGSGTGNMADADSNKLLVCDVYRPIHRYNEAIIVRGTANAVINCIIAELYDPITEPTTQDTTVSKSSNTLSPPTGTA